jgi:hypothetical protein
MVYAVSPNVPLSGLDGYEIGREPLHPIRQLIPIILAIQVVQG